jgi:hypothetical protein
VAGGEGAREPRSKLWAMQSGGLGEHDALRVATIQGAEAIRYVMLNGT